LRFELVPVPTEHVLEVMRWVLFRALESEEARKQDERSVTTLMADADARTRALLQIVAKAALKDEPRRFRDVADEMGEDRADVRALIDALNEEVLDDERELFETWVETVVGLEGREGSVVRISMRKDLAQVVRTAGRSGGG
jgi:hypothetical protein